MIISYIIGFFITFISGALYNNKCKTCHEIPMSAAFFVSLIWPISLAAVVIAVFYDLLGKIFNSISKK